MINHHTRASAEQSRLRSLDTKMPLVRGQEKVLCNKTLSTGVPVELTALFFRDLLPLLL